MASVQLQLQLVLGSAVTIKTCHSRLLRIIMSVRSYRTDPILVLMLQHVDASLGS